MQVSHAVEKSEYYASFACCRIKRVLCEFRKTSRKASSGMKNTDVGLCRFFYGSTVIPPILSMGRYALPSSMVSMSSIAALPKP